MPEGQVLEFSGVTKRFGAVAAVSEFTARVEPGRVTGFLGPNGAGKTTSLRILLGLVRATSGRATIGGVPYAKLTQPLQTVGAVLEASSFHPGRTAANHLRVYARAARISDTRVDEVLGLVGLSDAAGRKVGGFSLGMRQRLGLAYALIGDPGVLVLDEPANGLDPEGIRWMRGFLRQLAREGRTVLVSSHLLTEVQQTVDALLVIAQGRLVFQGGLDELADPSEYATVVDAPDRTALVSALTDAEVPYEVLRSGVTVRNLAPSEIGAIAAGAGVALSSLQRKGPALEEVFLELVSGARVHASATSAAAAPVVEPEPPVAEPEPEPPVAEPEPPIAEPEPPVAEPEPDPPVEEPDPPLEPVDAAPSATFATSAAGETASTSPADEPPVDPEAPRAFAVATTGVIDVVPPSSAWSEPSAAEAVFPEEDPSAPADADPDVEQIGEIDDELSGPERPFDAYDKTESDVEADAFFAAFDGAAADASAETPSDEAPEAGHDPDHPHDDEGGEQR